MLAVIQKGNPLELEKFYFQSKEIQIAAYHQSKWCLIFIDARIFYYGLLASMLGNIEANTM